MRELSLFTGIGGGLLGTMLLGWTPVGYVEWEEYPQKILQQRIKDGYIPNAPIFGDIREFNRTYARAYQGMVDVVTGGFPCQPFSVAGKQLGADDPRNMWPATLETVRLVGPRYCFFENVPGLVSSGYLSTILGQLSESGYDCRWRILSAAEVGAPHKRDRLWIVAHSAGNTRNERPNLGGDGRTEETEQARMGGAGSDVADATREQGGRIQFSGLAPNAGTGGKEAEVADAGSQREAEWRDAGLRAPARIEGRRDDNGGRAQKHERREWWHPEPRLGRLADGVPDRVDRLRGIGNGQVPAVVAAAWRLLTEDL